METSDWTIRNGEGYPTHFYWLDQPATEASTYASVSAAVHEELGRGVVLKPGNVYDLFRYECAAGREIGIWMRAEAHFFLTYFQDFNPCRE